jgi:hypothetical protein
MTRLGLMDIKAGGKPVIFDERHDNGGLLASPDELGCNMFVCGARIS